MKRSVYVHVLVMHDTVAPIPQRWIIRGESLAPGIPQHVLRGAFHEAWTEIGTAIERAVAHEIGTP